MQVLHLLQTASNTVLAFLAATPRRVECVNCDDTSWLEYLGAIGGFLGAVAAGVALVIALRSSADAKRSADAAEKALVDISRTALAAEQSADASRTAADAAQQELQLLLSEQSRRPEVSVAFEARYSPNQPADERVVVVVQIGIRNVGTRDAEHATVNFLWPQGVTIKPCRDRYGNGEVDVTILTTNDVLIAGQDSVDCIYPAHTLDRLPVDVSVLYYYRVVLPARATFPMSFRLIHGAMPNRGVRIGALLDASGAEPTIELAESPPRP